MKKAAALILITGILVSFLPMGAQAEIPQTPEESKVLFLKILEQLPGTVKDVWQNQALPLWWNMWTWTKSFWESTLGSKVESLWKKLWGLTGQETPDVRGEFEKETQEMQKDLWERFKELF